MNDDRFRNDTDFEESIGGFLKLSDDRGRDGSHNQIGTVYRSSLHIEIDADGGRSRLSKLVAILRRPPGQLCHFVNYRGEESGMSCGEVGIGHVDGIAVDYIFRGIDRALLAMFRLRKQGVQITHASTSPRERAAEASAGKR